MVAGGESWKEELTALYETDKEVDFARFVAAHEIEDDDTLAELIAEDGRLSLARGRPVEISRYLGLNKGSTWGPDALDAAIDVALRSASINGEADAAAMNRLMQAYPQHATAIREAAALNRALFSTGGLLSNLVPPKPRALPAEFGPRTPDGAYRYELQKLLGQGGFGQVFLANDRQLSEEGHAALVAIKVLPSRDTGTWGRQRLIDEATKARRVTHPNVVRVLDRGVSEQDEDFIVYEYVEAGDLAERFRREKPYPPRRAALLIAKIARGVQAAHSAGLVHCDLKPGNVMLTADLEPKVADFGIAIRFGDEQRRAHAARGDESDLHPIGNPAFISPEQYRMEEGAFTVPSDIYALGGMLYYLITGVLPNGQSVEEIAKTHNAQTGRKHAPSMRTTDATVDRDLDLICQRAMARDPHDRYSSAGELADDLEAWVRYEPVPWTKPSTLRVVQLWARRKPAMAAMLVLLMLVVFTGAFGWQHYARMAERERAEAEFAVRRKAEAATIAEKMRQLLSPMIAKGDRMTAEMLPALWALEYMLDPDFVGKPGDQRKVWEDRVNYVQGLINRAKDAHRGEELETLMWESAVAFWLASDGEYLRSEPLARENLAKFQKRLTPDDRWLRNMEAVCAVCAINRLHDKAAATPTANDVNTSDTELSKAIAVLEREQAALAELELGGPMHRLVLGSLVKAYGPQLANDSRALAEAQSQLEALDKQSGK